MEQDDGRPPGRVAPFRATAADADTPSSATALFDFDCDSDVFRVLNPGVNLRLRLAARSVTFS
ncbi:hypothetical protein [Streptomyces sp. CB01881]|uniref:hypothetical protein n=1 Tax=Streptomyces sp. CB01881 TaxID=2078691 RepID=UPI000CDC971F|nr:hypothetical protein [Streptomyces sp. CB01881]AUY53469.1 hypothetical protein C2142_36455 [Streptomyces sp. CB01881]TYC69618.1 hypothetical protein EH183_36495 [Streptomyces sp. CB01881]